MILSNLSGCAKNGINVPFRFCRWLAPKTNVRSQISWEGNALGYNQNWPPRVKLKIARTKLTWWAAKGQVWMTQVCKPFSVIHFLELEKFPFLIIGLWGNKNWPPCIKMRQMENYKNKLGLKGCKWSSLNDSGTQTLQSYEFLQSFRYESDALLISSMTQRFARNL